ncbi:DUF3943 domain-containing protein [Thiobacillus sp. SCN 63-57]|nr:DUF3943 domain-containing protein [Thiobacillus sp. SCN 63-57]
MHRMTFRMLFMGSVFACALASPGPAPAAEAEADTPERVLVPFNPGWQLTPDRFDPYLLAQDIASATDVTSPAASTPTDTPVAQLEGSVKREARPNYALPAVEIIGFNFLLNRFNYHFIDKPVYDTSLQTIRDNLSAKWVVDTDPFAVNQFMHPYQGSVYFGLARSSGLDYWTSLGYTFGGSLIWEIAGETGPPSINDFVTTGLGGTFLGEPLFRMANLLLEHGGDTPGFWRETGAAAISPPLGFNRLAFGDRFRAVFQSHNPATYSYVRFGWNKIDDALDGIVGQTVKRDTATVDFHMSYGLPGKNGYRYTRPFDYFDFDFTATTANVFENIMSRGLLIGKEYTAGDNYRGIWGLYGSYDYISPQTFRVSSTAVSFGTTAQWWISDNVALQGTALAGVGYGAAGTIHGQGERNYHYGATPQALLSLRLLLGERVNVDLTARSYYVSDVASTEDRGTERIFRGDAAFTMRIHGPHALTLKYNASRRDARYPDIPNTLQTVRTVSLLYTYYFGDARFGAVEWREAGER